MSTRAVLGAAPGAAFCAGPCWCPGRDRHNRSSGRSDFTEDDIEETNMSDHTTAAGETTGTGELLTALGQDLRAILTEELDRLRSQFDATLRESRRAALLLGGAAVLGGLAAGSSAAVTLRLLSTFLPRPVAALVATGLYGGGAVALARLGLTELRRAQESLPTRSSARSGQN